MPDDISLDKVEAGGVPALWITPPNAGSTVILYFHGGGYVLGSPIGNAAMVARIARAAGAGGRGSTSPGPAC